MSDAGERLDSADGPEERRGQFNSAWILMVVLLVSVGVLLHQRNLLVLAACLLTVIPIAWWWKRLALGHVEVERKFDRRCAFPGETIALTLRVTNRKLLPLTWLEVSDEVPTALPLATGALLPTHVPQVGYLHTVTALRWYERIVRHHQLRCTARGIFMLGPAHLRSGDAFTLFEAQSVLAPRDRLVVYPAIWPLQELGLPAKEPFGEHTSQRRLFADPLRTIGIRDHRPEDGLHHIHWKATAHRAALQVRVFEPAATPHIVLMLNVATFEHHWQGVLPELLERTISVAASLATWALGQRYKVGLVANGCMSLSDQPIRVPSGRAPGQLAALLEAMAGVTSFAIVSIQELLRRESPRLPWGATLVVLTAHVGDELCAALLRLHQAGRRIVLVSLAEEPPPRLEGVVVHHLPSDAPAFGRMDLRQYDPQPALLAAGMGSSSAAGRSDARG